MVAGDSEVSGAGGAGQRAGTIHGRPGGRLGGRERHAGIPGERKAVAGTPDGSGASFQPAGGPVREDAGREDHAAPVADAPGSGAGGEHEPDALRPSEAVRRFIDYCFYRPRTGDEYADFVRSAFLAAPEATEPHPDVLAARKANNNPLLKGNQDYLEICLRMEHRARTDPDVIARIAEWAEEEALARAAYLQRWGRNARSENATSGPIENPTQEDTMEDRIIEALTGADPLTTTSVSRILGIRKPTASKALKAMLADGRLDCRKGPRNALLWSLPAGGTDPAVPATGSLPPTGVGGTDGGMNGKPQDQSPGDLAALDDLDWFRHHARRVVDEIRREAA